MKIGQRKTLKKLIIVAILWTVVLNSLQMFDLAASRPGAQAAVSALNGGDYEADVVAATSRIPSTLYGAVLLMLIFASAIILKKEITKIMKKLNFSSLTMLLLIGVLAFTSGCRKPYDKPTFKDIKANETAFMIQAMGDTENQDMFASPEMLAKNLVAAKKIQIPHRWVQTGRKNWVGHYEDAVLFLVVNRSPVTRVWDADASKGTSSQNQALTAESGDSLFVSTGFTLTGYIEPVDASKFLYKFQGDSLATVIDTQVKNSIQTKFTELCAEYDLMKLPQQKTTMMKAIRDEVIPFYKAWGITLGADMGFVGGFTYTDAIQLEIDEVFKAEKGKERAAAIRVAKDETLLMELNISSNSASIVRINADAKSYAIEKEALALQNAGPLYIQDRFIMKWDGILSKVSGEGFSTLLNVGNVID